VEYFVLDGYSCRCVPVLDTQLSHWCSLIASNENLSNAKFRLLDSQLGFNTFFIAVMRP